jgi:hypothetical protein
MSENRNDIVKAFEYFSEYAAAEDLCKGIRRLLLIALKENADYGLNTDLDGNFFIDLERLFDLLDTLQEYQSKE